MLVSPKFAPPPLKVPMIMTMNFGSQLYFWELVWVKQLVSLMGWLYMLSNTSLGSDPRVACDCTLTVEGWDHKRQPKCEALYEERSHLGQLPAAGCVVCQTCNFLRP